jgi:hypothetical protein
MTIDELLDEAVVNSHDVARIFKLPHNLVLAEVDERRGNLAFKRAVYRHRRAEYQDCWSGQPEGNYLRHVEMNRIGLTWLVLQWQLPESQSMLGPTAEPPSDREFCTAGDRKVHPPTLLLLVTNNI